MGHDQLDESQKILDRYTDYDNYSRCCAGHDDGMEIGDQDECCITDDECCNTVKDMIEQCEDCHEICDESFGERTDCCESIAAACNQDCEQCSTECQGDGNGLGNCPQTCHATWDDCIGTCGICVDNLPLPQLEYDEFTDLMEQVPPCTDNCSIPSQPPATSTGATVPRPSSETVLHHWQRFPQSYYSSAAPSLMCQVPPTQPPQHLSWPFESMVFGCDPMVPVNKYPSWQQQQLELEQPVYCSSPYYAAVIMAAPTEPNFDSALPLIVGNLSLYDSSPITTTTTTTASSSSTNNKSRACRWLRSNGTICGAEFGRTEDLKKHVKAHYGTKSCGATTTCRWDGCTATFASEAALTGHLSKKHLWTTTNEKGPWECPIAGCDKSFMYKQVRDEHVASSHNGDRMHCPICHQSLNAEGSNFRRHMANHDPKHKHIKCRHERLGCPRSFPRLDNLRRHEACCKYGKRAAAGGLRHHHHHHHHHPPHPHQ